MKSTDRIRLDELGVTDLSELPDWVFGQRHLIGVQGSTTGVQGVAHVCGLPMPRRYVIWSLTVTQSYQAAQGGYFRLAWCDATPTTEAEVMLLPPVLPGLGAAGLEPRKITTDRFDLYWRWQMRLFGEGVWPRWVMWLNGLAISGVHVSVYMEVSDIPRSIPVWMARQLGFYV